MPKKVKKSKTTKKENEKNKDVFSRSIKIRLYLNKEQKKICDTSFGIDRFVYNYALGLKKNRYDNHKENLSWMEISKMFTLMKQSDKYDYLNIASRSVIEQSLKKLESAYKGFFDKKSGFPKFKKKNKSEKSFVLTDPSSIIGDKYIKLPKLGLVKIKGLRSFNGRIKNVTIKQNPAGEYFATFAIEDVKREVRVFNKEKKAVGIDVNLENFSTDSNGQRIENPRFKKECINKIKFYQRQMSKLHRKTNKKNDPDSSLPKNQSKKYLKIKNKLATLFNKVGNKKADFLHKLSLYYVKNHDVIIVEDLMIANMIKNHKLAESISQVSWGEFFRQLEYKAQWYGAEFYRVPPHNTSKMCSNCDEINHDITLADRVWTCSSCKTKHIRDFNSSMNILIKKMGKGYCPKGWTREFSNANTRLTPVEFKLS